MSSIPHRMVLWPLSFLLSLLPVQPVCAQVIHAVPIPGDQFAVHLEQVSSGTYTFATAAPGKFKTTLSADFSALVVKSMTQTHGWEASYRYDHLRIENQVEGASPTLLEVWPTRMSLDGDITYDSRLHPDTPPPMLVQILLGDFRARIGNQGDVIRIEECEAYHTVFPFLDLTQPINETWMHRPPEPLSVGLKWVEDRPFRLWASRVTLPASMTYEVKTLPPATNRSVSLSLSRTLKSTTPQRISIPIGSAIPLVLRYDALGPDIEALLPDLSITSLAVNTTGSLEYRLDRGFLAAKQTSDQFDIQMEVPPVDGTGMTLKHLRIDRTTSLNVTYIPAGKFSEEVRLILFGR